MPLLAGLSSRGELSGEGEVRALVRSLLGVKHAMRADYEEGAVSHPRVSLVLTVQPTILGSCTSNLLVQAVADYSIALETFAGRCVGA